METTTSTPRYNYKKTNWKKFNKTLCEKFKLEDKLETNRNLTIEEIDKHINILEHHINKTIEENIPKIKQNKDKYYLKYENNMIKKLHSNKTLLINRLYYIKYDSNIKHSRQEINRIKITIKKLNEKLHKEYTKTVTAYWNALSKNINYRDSNKFFPNINKLFRPSNRNNIKNLKIDIHKNEFNLHLSKKLPQLIINNEINIDDDKLKIEIIGEYFESINSARYTNDNSVTKRLADEKAKKLNTLKENIRKNKSFFTSFTDNNPAHDPRQDIEEPKFLYNYIEIGNIIRKLKNKTSSGPDKIPAIVIKNLPIDIIKEYTIIFNNSFNQAYYPRRWKEAKVLPIPKKNKNQEEPQNYRPISLTSNISKIFEKLIKEQILKHSDQHNIIPNNQYGFKNNHSTTHALHKFSSDINNYLHKDLAIAAILLDLEKAFDSVWKNGLLLKLDKYKFPMGLILLIMDMIDNKTFRTWDGSNLSNNIFKITEGLQQGTVTSPILFNIFNSEIINLYGLNASDKLHSIAYADDLIIYKADKDIDKIQSTLQRTIDNITAYY